MGRSPCCDKTGLKKGPWTPEEDTKLINYIHLNGPGNWRTLPKNAALQRCGKSCRLRWTNYLRPDIRRGRFSFQEEETIIQLHTVLGNKWSAIAARLPGRTDNEIKNYWNTHIRKRLLRMGIDPVTHAPRLDFLNSPHFNNLSNLLCLQTLLNPHALRLALSLLSSSNNNINTNGQENPNHTLLHNLPENQLLSNSDHLLLQQIPSSNIAPTSSAANSQSQSSQPDPNPILGNFMLQDNYLTTNDQHQTSLPASSDPLNFWHGIPDLTSDNSSFQSISMNNSSNNSSQNYSLESVMPTPLSSPGPVMNPSSAAELIIGSQDEGQSSDEKENFCSSLMRFEIPEGFEFDAFM